MSKNIHENGLRHHITQCGRHSSVRQSRRRGQNVQCMINPLLRTITTTHAGRRSSTITLILVYISRYFLNIRTYLISINLVLIVLIHIKLAWELGTKKGGTHSRVIFAKRIKIRTRMRRKMRFLELSLSYTVIWPRTRTCMCIVHIRKYRTAMERFII